DSVRKRRPKINAMSNSFLRRWRHRVLAIVVVFAIVRNAAFAQSLPESQRSRIDSAVTSILAASARRAHRSLLSRMAASSTRTLMDPDPAVTTNTFQFILITHEPEYSASSPSRCQGEVLADDRSAYAVRRRQG